MTEVPAFTVSNLIELRDKSANTAFMDFNNAVVNNPDALFVFYEGQDNDYYFPRLQSNTWRTIEAIKCKGKSNVIKVCKILISKPEYRKYHKGFFADKDFDLNTDPVLSEFYVTSGYSIENFYVSDNCMEMFLKQMLNFHTGEALLVNVMADYRNLRQQYFDAILLFNTWYCAIKRKYGDSITGINLDKDMPKGFVKFDFRSNQVYQQYTMAEIYTEFPAAVNYPLTAQDLSEAETYIRTNMLKNLRGKYCLSFMEKFISSLTEKIKNTPEYSAHRRVINIQYNNIMSILAPFADTEQETIDYIVRVAS